MESLLNPFGVLSVTLTPAFSLYVHISSQAIRMEGRVDAPALDKEVLLQLFCTFPTCCRVRVPITEVGEMGVINRFIDLDAEWNLHENSCLPLVECILEL